MIAATPERQAEALLDAVRALQPRHLMRLAGLWAGVCDGSIDPNRQRRRNAARLAVRYAARREDESAAVARGIAAAEAVGAALSAGGRDAVRRLRGPAADAIFAVVDALDALAHQRVLSEPAFEELLRPWRELEAELAAPGEGT